MTGTLILLLYAAVVLLSWGVFIAGDDVRSKSPRMNLFMALIWPIAWLLIIGFVLGGRK